MIRLTWKTVVQTMIILGVARPEAIRAGEWTEPVEACHELQPCVSYRARLDGEFLVVQAAHAAGGWHTFAMDNKRRAEEKLAGRQSLGVDGPTEITLSRGLEAAGGWHQSPPKDFSKPEIQWFTWGFEGQALFAAKVRRSGTGPAQVAVGGQACTETACKKVDVEISLPLTDAAKDAASRIDFKTLIPVR